MSGEKFWVRSKHANRIKYRALNGYEIRSPDFYANGIETHDTWASAHAATLDDRERELVDAKKKLKRAEAALAKAKTMTEPTP